MIKKRYMILILCIITLLSIQFVSANDNADDITILGASEDMDILQAPTVDKSYTDLKNLIDQAGDGDEINLEYANYKYNNGNDPKTGINITKNLTIIGNGAVIDGASASSLFNISGVTVTLKNLTITHANYNGGYSAQDFVGHSAINSQGTLNIIDCTFENNELGYDYADYLDFNGSVIKSTNDINIVNSIFTNNIVPNSGIIYTTGRVSVKGSHFQENYAYNKESKGVVIYTGEGIDLIENSYIGWNYGKGSGSIYIANPDSVTTIRNSTFDSNNVGKNGGAIYTEGKIDLIENSIFDSNTALVGAGIYATSINKIDNSTFDGNGFNRAGSKGGAIYLTGNDDLFINNSHIDDNLGWEGAGIYTHGSVTVINSNLTKNVGDDYNFDTKGSSICANGDVYIENVIMRDNFAVEGGVIYSNGTVTIKNSNDIGNNGVTGQHVTSNGGVVYAKGNVNIENTTFGDNIANIAGGAIYSEGNVNFYNSKVDGSAETTDGSGDGGFIYAKGNVNIENSTIESVYMKVASQNYQFSGAVFTKKNIVVRNSNFTKINKEVHSIGGAIRALGNAEIYNSNFTHNKAVKYGALYVDGTLDIYDSYFYNNTNSVAFAEQRAIVNNTQFVNNTCNVDLNGRVLGSNSTLNITNSVIDGTYSRGSQFKGSVFADGDVFVDNCNFTNSFAHQGGSKGLLVYTNSDATVLNSYFDHNSYQGHTCFGGIYTGQNAYVENCTFTNATVIGGEGQTEGLCVYAEENITFINSSIEDFFSRNTPEGALSGNYVNVYDSNFTDIKGFGAFGAAIHANVANVYNSNFYMVNSSDNKDNGGAIYANNTYAYGNNFTACHAGRGVFTLTPMHGKNYKVRFVFKEHKFDFDLPKAEQEGVRLWVEQDEEGVYFDVAQHFEKPRKLTLNVYCRGKKAPSPFLIEGEWVCPIEDLSEGVN